MVSKCTNFFFRKIRVQPVQRVLQGLPRPRELGLQGGPQGAAVANDQRLLLSQLIFIIFINYKIKI